MKKSFTEIFKKEFKNVFKDSAAVLVMVVGVIAYSVFYAIPYTYELVKEVPIAVIDNNHTQLSKAFLRDLDSNDNVKITKYVSEIQEAKDLFYSGNVKGIVVIPDNFSQDLKKGKQVRVSVFADSGYLIIYKSVYGGVQTVASSFGAKIEVASLMKSGVPKNLAIRLKQPYEFVTVPLFNPSGGYATYVYPIVLIIILHQTLIVGIGLILGYLNETKQNYFDVGDNCALVLFARASVYVCLYMFYSFFYFLVYPAIVNYPMSYNLLALLLVLIPFFYSIVFFAHTISYFFRSRESALMFLVVSSLLLVFLPGFVWPREALPAWLNFIAAFIPATKGIDAIIRINQFGASFSQIFHDFSIIVGLCFLYFILAIKVLKRRL